MMKRLVIVLGTVLLTGLIAYPVFAHGPGWGWGGGHHMMGYGGGGPGYCWDYGRGYGSLTQEQREKLDKLDQKFYTDNATIRDEIWTKSAQLDDVLSNPNPDTEKAKALQKEINDLRNRKAENRLEYDLEARKIVPEGRLGRGYGRGGYGWHMRGHGPGACWYE